MAKASMKLPDGTTVEVEGSVEEIQKIIGLHKSTHPHRTSFENSSSKKEKPNKELFDISAIVNEIKNCNEAAAIEENILDRTSQVDRILLPLYISQKYIEGKPKLTSGEISKVLGDLGISIFKQNVGKTLSGAGSKYVMGDKIRKKGQLIRYTISRRGQQYIEAVIENKVE